MWVVSPVSFLSQKTPSHPLEYYITDTVQPVAVYTSTSHFNWFLLFTNLNDDIDHHGSIIFHIDNAHHTITMSNT